MRVRGTLTAQEKAQLRSMGQYNFGLTLTNLTLVMLGITPIVNSVGWLWLGLRHAPNLSLRFLAVEWLVCTALIGFILAVIFRYQRKNFERLIGGFPDFYLVEAQGIKLCFLRSGETLVEWRVLKEWWVRDNLLLVNRIDTLDPLVLPLGDLPAADVERLRDKLQENWKAETKALT